MSGAFDIMSTNVTFGASSRDLTSSEAWLVFRCTLGFGGSRFTARVEEVSLSAVRSIAL